MDNDEKNIENPPKKPRTELPAEPRIANASLAAESCSASSASNFSPSASIQASAVAAPLSPPLLQLVNPMQYYLEVQCILQERSLHLAEDNERLVALNAMLMEQNAQLRRQTMGLTLKNSQLEIQNMHLQELFRYAQGVYQNQIRLMQAQDTENQDSQQSLGSVFYASTSGFFVPLASKAGSNGSSSTSPLAGNSPSSPAFGADLSPRGLLAETSFPTSGQETTLDSSSASSAIAPLDSSSSSSLTSLCQTNTKRPPSPST